MSVTCGTKGSSHRRTKNLEIEQNRIRKLLASEYSDFADTILVESPFAETTRNGRGIRQVSLGLTSSKLIVAADVFRKNTEFVCPRSIDPTIESFELISLYPLQYVYLSVFNRRHRKTLKARFIDGRVNYYELGGIHRRNIFWEKWCEAVKNLLADRVEGSSLSETTAASSSSSSTLYILSSEIEIRNDPKKQGEKSVCRIWTHYGGAGDYAPTWRQRDLYLGPSHNELVSGRYTPIPVRFAGASLEDIKDELRDLSPSKHEKGTRSWPRCHCYKEKYKNNGGLCDVLFIRDKHNRKYLNTSKFFATCHSCPCNHLQARIFEGKVSEKRNVWYKQETLDEKQKSPKRCLTRRISRFGIGVPENCHSGLVLGPTRRERECLSSKSALKNKQNLYTLMENCVKIWEGERKGCCKSAKFSKHFRRYGLCTAPHFLYALGPWSVQPGERSTLQGRRSFSLVTIRRQPADSELRLPVSRRQLATSISYCALQSGRFGSIGSTARGRVVLFWTPEYWYRPRPASAAYRELRQHLNHLRNYRLEKERPTKRKLFSRRKKCLCDEESIIVAEEKPSFLERIFSGNVPCRRKKAYENQENSTTVQLRRLLKMDFRITIWDINSTILARQLTLIDRDLFTRIPPEEIEILVFQRSSRNAPNLAAWIAFSHRVSCLTVSEILAVKKLPMRGRIIARLVNAASKCFAMGNFHSCKSILAGLQAPPIFRLRNSWSYLRVHHANRYEVMERLSKLYKNPRASAYRRAWAKVERNPPAMPHVGDLLTKILGLNNPKLHKKCSNIIHTNDNINHPKDLNASSVNVNKDTPLKSSLNLEQKQSTNKGGIVASVLTRIKYKRDQKTIYEEKTDSSWTTREQDLAWKYFYRWNNAVLKRKVYAKEMERLREMDTRMKRVLEVASWLMECQKRAQGYEFPVHSFTREFLLKTRYREDRENFFISLKLEEPSMIT
ncbi:Ras-specific guanine nucleotide-releasing factor RalGPS1 [Anthophora retusa]